MIILCIDNDQEDIELFEEAVATIEQEAKVISAPDGRLGLALLHSLALEALPNYIFLDINMPYLNGKETLIEIRKHARYNHIQIVMQSTGLTPKDSLQYQQLGATHFLAKACSMKELRTGLSAILATPSIASPDN